MTPKRVNFFLYFEEEDIIKRQKALQIRDLYKKGKKLLRENKFISAREIFLEVIEKHQSYYYVWILYKAWNYLGYIYLQLKNLEKAKFWVKKVIKSDKCIHLHHSSFYNYACVLSLENHPEKSLEALKKAINLKKRYLISSREDPDLYNLRHLPELKDFLQGFDSDGNLRLLLEIEGWGSPNVSAYENEVDRDQLRNPNEIVIEDEKIWIEFTYPLSVRVEFEYNNKGGFSRLDLWRCIYEGYKRIYDEEEADAGNAPNLMNRARSGGRYGIWGHYMSNLYLEWITYDDLTKTISMFIGS